MAQVMQHLAQIGEGRLIGEFGPEQCCQAFSRVPTPRFRRQIGQQHTSFFIRQFAGPAIAQERETAEQLQGEFGGWHGRGGGFSVFRPPKGDSCYQFFLVLQAIVVAIEN